MECGGEEFNSAEPDALHRLSDRLYGILGGTIAFTGGQEERNARSECCQSVAQDVAKSFGVG